MTPHLWHSSTKPAQANLASPIKLQYKLIKLVYRAYRVLNVYLLNQETPCMMPNCASFLLLNDNLHCFIGLKIPALFACCSFWNHNTSPSIFLHRS